jgi:hypothetical protein
MINPGDSLYSMPLSIKDDIFSKPNTAWDYVITWATTHDYGWGYSEMSDGLDDSGIRLLKSGNDHLKSAISQLLGDSRTARVSDTSRMAVEIFMKSFIALKVGLTDAESRKYSHDLDKLVQRCKSLSKSVEWEMIENSLNTFPDIKDRYDSPKFDPVVSWISYFAALSVGCAITREFTTRDIRTQVYPPGFIYQRI